MSTTIDIGPKDALKKVVAEDAPEHAENVLACVQFVKSEIDHGKGWKSEDLAKVLNRTPGTMMFQMDMSEVNEILERKGYHLTTRGKHGQEYFVEEIHRSSGIVTGFQRSATRKLRRSVIFAHGVLNNHADKLSEDQKRRLEKQAEVQAWRYLAAQSKPDFIKPKSKNKPELMDEI